MFSATPRPNPKGEKQVQLMWVDAECDQSSGAGSGVSELISGAKLTFVFPHVGGAYASALQHQLTEMRMKILVQKQTIIPC